MKHSAKEIHFLDLIIYKGENGLLHTTIFCRPLSRNALLRADSNHPRQLIKNIPAGQFLRLRRNCSSDSDFHAKAISMKEHFQTRGYSSECIEEAYQRAARSERHVLLNESLKPQSSSRLYFSTKHNAMAAKIKHIILKHWDILKSVPSLIEISANPPLITFKRVRNLRDR